MLQTCVKILDKYQMLWDHLWPRMVWAGLFDSLVNQGLWWEGRELWPARRTDSGARDLSVYQSVKIYFVKLKIDQCQGHSRSFQFYKVKIIFFAMFESQNMWIYEYKAFSLKYSYIGCGNPGHVPNGVRLNFTSFDVGAAATYQCHAGFLLNGSSTMFCQNNGNGQPYLRAHLNPQQVSCTLIFPFPLTSHYISRNTDVTSE